ncbi:MAG: DNA-binding protein [Treponema sp.]|jgi:predicted DNA-binding protein with PD1-like motif|nr:DNA-binding protein [Treponema sp.]
MFELSAKIREARVVRFDPDMDLLLELRKYVSESKIKNAVILNGIGSSKSYSYHVVASPDLPPKEMYPKEEKPLDIISVQGFVLDGRVHAHIIFSDEKISFGGHLEEGVKLLTFAIITLGIIDDNADISKWDKL